MVIYKYELHPYDNKQVLEVPDDFSYLKMGIQNGKVVLWAAVDPTKPTEKIGIHPVSTEEEFEWKDSWIFLDTIQHPHGLVLHYFIEYRV